MAESKRSTVDWRGRQKQQAIESHIKKFILFLVLGAVLGGAFVYRAPLWALINPPKQEPVAQKAPEPPPPVEKKEVEPPPLPPAVKKEEPKVVEKVVEPPPPAPEREVVEADEVKAKALIEEGLALLPQFDSARNVFSFEKAALKFSEAKSLKCTEETFELASRWEHKASEFKKAMGHVGVVPFAYQENAYLFQLSNGNKMRGLLLSETPNEVEYQKISDTNPAVEGLMIGKLPRTAVAGKAQIPLENRKAEFQALLDEAESAMNPNGGAEDFYYLAYLAYRLAMGEQLVDYLNRAYEKVPDGALADTFVRDFVDNTIEKAALQTLAGRYTQANMYLTDLLKAMGHHDYAKERVADFRQNALEPARKKSIQGATVKVVEKKAPPPKVDAVASSDSVEKKEKRSAEKLVAEVTKQKEEEVLFEKRNIAGNASAQPLLEKADPLFDQAMAVYKNYRGAGGNDILKKTLALLDQCLPLYEKAQELDPKNGSIESRIHEASMIRYACMKYQTLR